MRRVNTVSYSHHCMYTNDLIYEYDDDDEMSDTFIRRNLIHIFDHAHMLYIISFGDSSCMCLSPNPGPGMCTQMSPNAYMVRFSSFDMIMCKICTL